MFDEIDAICVVFVGFLAISNKTILLYVQHGGFA